jgi:hypothetical protein
MDRRTIRIFWTGARQDRTWVLKQIFAMAALMNRNFRGCVRKQTKKDIWPDSLKNRYCVRIRRLPRGKRYLGTELVEDVHKVPKSALE